MKADLIERLRLNDAEIYLPILGEAADALASQAAEIQRLREAGDRLNGYAGHDNGCQIMTHGVWSDPMPCNCGYTTAINAWKELGS